ncbi:unnamed protein product [Parnassius apollo]|uniref:(apollo) hypothetical protein n=1 Tax=Parnassius apollo TaxID=110799 RepID=A0A8S3YAR0_PARAO|nr:unnamed protein product [Parnassius apollo]
MIDIALISETRFTPKTHINFNNYTVYTTNHPIGNSHGGTAAIIKNNIKHYPIEEYRTEKIQATSIKLVDSKLETIFSAVYCPPKHTISANDFAKYFSTLGNRFICAELRIDLTSDHTPVILNVTTTVNLVAPLLRIYNSNTTDWTIYKNKITTETELKTKINTIEKIERQLEQLNMTIHIAANSATPKRTGNGQPLKHNSYPKDIKEKIQERRRLRKIWHTTGYPSDKTAFNRHSNELKALISTLENDNIQHYLSNLDPTRDTNYSLWKATKNLKRPKNHITYQ